MLLAAIVAAEAAFWVLLGAGLAARYLLGRPRLGLILLMGSPVADLTLLVLTGADLLGGARPTQIHALAATYLGFTVAFGARTVAWADDRFARRIAAVPVPARSARSPEERAQNEWALFRRAVLGWAVASALLLGLTALVAVADDVGRAGVLVGYVGVLSGALVVWFLVGPLPAVLSTSKGVDRMRKLPHHDRWAPWWLYLIVILGANYARQLVMPVGTIPEWAVVVLVLAVSAALFGVVTAAYRATRR